MFRGHINPNAVNVEDMKVDKTISADLRDYGCSAFLLAIKLS